MINVFFLGGREEASVENKVRMPQKKEKRSNIK